MSAIGAKRTFWLNCIWREMWCHRPSNPYLVRMNVLAAISAPDAVHITMRPLPGLIQIRFSECVYASNSSV